MHYDDTIEVWRGREKRSAQAQTGENGERFFISPFTHIKCPLPPLTDPPSPQLRWFTKEHRRLTKLLLSSRRCHDTAPRRPTRDQPQAP